MKANSKVEQKDAQQPPPSITKTQAQTLITEHKAPQGQQSNLAKPQLPEIDPKHLTIDKKDPGIFNRNEFCKYYKGTYHPTVCLLSP